MALGSLSGPARVDGAWLWGVHLHVQVGAQRNRRVEPHPAQRAAPGSASAAPPLCPLERSPLGLAPRPSRARARRRARRLAAWRSPALPGLRPARAYRSCAQPGRCDPVNDPTIDPRPPRAGRNGSSSVRRSVYHVSYEKYLSKVSCNNNRAGARAGGPNVCSFGSVRSATRVAPPITKCQVVCRMLAGSPRRPLCSTSP